MRDLAPLIQFRKREKHLWRSVTSSKIGYLNSISSEIIRKSTDDFLMISEDIELFQGEQKLNLQLYLK